MMVMAPKPLGFFYYIEIRFIGFAFQRAHDAGKTICWQVFGTIFMRRDRLPFFNENKARCVAVIA